MKLSLLRIFEDDKITQGVLYIDGELNCFTLENPFHDPKVMGDTRIPEGVYEIKHRKVESKKTLHYRKKFPWFKWHLELIDVPCFKYVYLHIGNTAKDTDGCILVGDGMNLKKNILNSTKAYERFYKIVNSALCKGNRVVIEIADIC